MEFLAIELGYVDLGEATATASVPITASATLSASGGSLSLIPRIPIGDVGSIFGRIGISGVEAKLSAAGAGLGASDSTGAAGLILGVGGEINFSESVALRVEWERHSFDEVLRLANIDIDAPDIDLITGSIVISF